MSQIKKVQIFLAVISHELSIQTSDLTALLRMEFFSQLFYYYDEIGLFSRKLLLHLDGSGTVIN